MSQPVIMEDLRDFKPAETTSTVYTLLLYGKVFSASDISYMDEVNDGFSLEGCQETRVSDYHLTITHSRLTTDFGKIPDYTRFMGGLTEFTKLTATVTGVAIFYTPEGFSRVALMECSDARSIRERVVSQGIPVSSTWSYTPHITLGSCNKENYVDGGVASALVYPPRESRIVRLRLAASLYKKSEGVKTLVWSTEDVCVSR